MESLPFSQAAENNREPILQQLRRFLRDAESVMEIGAGTSEIRRMLIGRELMKVTG